jgi:phosphatidylinositol alpha-mannosyltransferase
MKVAMVCPYSLSRPGGVQGQVLGLARELRKLDVDVRVVGPCDGPPPDPMVIDVGPTVEWESNGSIAPIAPGRAPARRTTEALRSLAPDVVHLHEPVVPGPALTAAIWFSGPMIGTFHASGDDHIVLWNGIEIERIASADPTLSARPSVLFLGRHEPRKGLAVLLDAWEKIDRDARLWVIGTGPQTKELRRRGVPDVEWIGTVADSERNARMRGATVFCAPSLSGESFGVVLLEAMAAGTAIVASDIDGYKNVARADRDALLVPPDDPESLRVALRLLLDEPTQRARLVQSGHERATEFSMERLAQRYLELYERAMAPAV